MSSQARQILTLGVSKKRKELEGSSGFRAPPRKKLEPVKPTPKPATSAHTQPPSLPAKNRLLAGYLAHEFLTKGTLFGEPFDPAQPEQKEQDRAEPKPAAYADVAYLLKFDGTHIRDVVNPTQLGRWIQNGGFSS